MEERTRKAVGAIITQPSKDTILLVKKVKTEDIESREIAPEWDIPKGGIKPGEGQEDAIFRELGEEVGSKDFNLVKQLDFGLDFNFPSGARWDNQNTLLFYMMYTGKDARFKPISDEISEALFFPVVAAISKVTYRTTAELIEKAVLQGLIRKRH